MTPWDDDERSASYAISCRRGSDAVPLPPPHQSVSQVLTDMVREDADAAIQAGHMIRMVNTDFDSGEEDAGDVLGDGGLESDLVTDGPQMRDMLRRAQRRMYGARSGARPPPPPAPAHTPTDGPVIRDVGDAVTL